MNLVPSISLYNVIEYMIEYDFRVMMAGKVTMVQKVKMETM